MVPLGVFSTQPVFRSQIRNVRILEHRAQLLGAQKKAKKSKDTQEKAKTPKKAKKKAKKKSKDTHEVF